MTRLYRHLRHPERIALTAFLGLTSIPAMATGQSTPRPAPANASIRIPFDKYVLPNGLTVVLSPDKSTPTVAVMMTYHVGSKNEVVGRTGFAHLFEHVMFTGSGHVPYGTHDQATPKAWAAEQRQHRQRLTQYYETIPSNYLEHALWMESDRMGWLLDALDTAKYNAQRASCRRNGGSASTMCRTAR